MYNEFYNFKEKPFVLSPSSRFLYLGEVHKEALALLTYGITERKGFTLLTGEVGTGKTTMIHALLAGLGENTQYVYLSNPLLTENDFMKYLAFSIFKKKVRFESKSDFLIEFEAFLKTCLHQQKSFILIIDEAHKLSFELLEEIRLLSNMETADEKLINIFLAGQPELNEKLSSPECRALLQRITSRYHIEPLDLQSTHEYISKRLKIAGVDDERKIFSKAVIKSIHLYSKGYPRMINILADNALLLGYARGTKKISPSMIQECYEDLQLDGSFQKSPPPELQQKKIRKKNNPMSGSYWKWAAILVFLIAVSSFAIFRYGEHGLRLLSAFVPLRHESSVDTISAEKLQAKEKIEQKTKVIVKKDLSEKRAVPIDKTPHMESKKPENISSVKPGEAESSAKDNGGAPQEATVIVKQGDTLIALAANVYGRADEKIVNLVQERNPEIKDTNFIRVGQKIVFPALSGMNQGPTFTVNIAASKPFESAQKLFLELLEKGYDVYMIPIRSTLKQKKVFRITLGNFSTAQEAEDYAEEILRNDVSDYAKVIQLEMK